MAGQISGTAGEVLVAAATVNGIKSWTVDYTLDALDTTDFADSGLRTYIAGLSGWSGSFEGYKEGLVQILTVIASSPITLKLYEDATYFWSGSAIITGVHANNSHDTVVSYNYDFVGIAGLTAPLG